MITSFSGDNRFLSNFWMHPVSFEGIEFPSNEHAYVAAKTLDLDVRKQIAQVDSPGKVKRIGRTLELRSDWEQVKVPIMQNLIEQKFKDPVLRELLMKTAPHELVEGNTWGDTFWGECPIGVGKNMLGKLLMAERDGLFR